MAHDLFNEVDYTSPTQRRVAGPSVRRSRHRPDDVKRIHAIFGLLAFGLGIAGAVVAYKMESSIALAIFVFFVIQSFVGRGLGDVVTDPHKAKRFVYFTLQPALIIGVFYVTYALWGTMWLSALLGIVVRSILWQLLAVIVFPDIHEEETADSLGRFKTGGV